MKTTIPGIDSRARTDLAVLRPYVVPSQTAIGFSHWLASPASASMAILGVLLLTAPVLAQDGRYSYAQAFDALLRWMPFLFTSGFLFNILISFLAMLVGTVAGALLGLGQISLLSPVRWLSWLVTQTFRNSPWLVILFVVMLAFPFEFSLGDKVVSIPDWVKAVIGLSLPIMANIAEIVRGAVQSIPDTQWEAAESLAFNRRQTLWMIILPQCLKRMIPPWMNWYAILTMATPLCSILGVEEIVNLSRQAIEAEDNHPELLVPFYSFVLLMFFIYCYPIARATIALERKFAVKI